MAPKPATPRIRARHWLVALAVAGVVHAGLFLRYEPTTAPGAQDPGERAVRIALAPTPPEPKEQPPEPEPEPDPEPEPQPEPPEPEPEPEPQPEPDPVPTPVPDPEPVPRPEPKPEPAPSPSSAEPAKKTRTDTTGGVTAVPPDYHSRLRAWLERHRHYPRRARRLDQQGTVVLELVIGRDGRVLEWQIRESSGHRLLDDAVADMIKRADPMPAIPADVSRQRLALTVPISFRLR